ncbi:MAG: hypothetical protein ABF289_11885 [Clostridiales bacterium]
MGKNKKFITLTIFILAFVVFVTTAFAEVISYNGYKQIKESIKDTYSNLEYNGYDSYTLETETSLKDGNETLFRILAKNKHNTKDNIREEINEMKIKGADDSYNYYYDDSNVSINSQDGINFEQVNTPKWLNSNEIIYENENFLKSDEFKDIERIIDGVVGDLSKHVIIEDTKDGEKAISGSLNEIQIPSMINALVSYGYKSYINNESMHYTMDENMSYEKQVEKINELSVLKDNIFIKNIDGKALLNEDNSIKKLTISGEISGLDKDKNEKTLNFESVSVLKDTNNTVVKKPDLSNKKVEIVENEMNNFTKKYVGKWKTDIIEVENDKFVKKGEKILEILDVDEDNVDVQISINYTDDPSKNKSEKLTFTLKDYDYLGKITIDDEKTDIILCKLGDNQGVTLNLQTALMEEYVDNGKSYSNGYTVIESVFNGDYQRLFK